MPSVTVITATTGGQYLKETLDSVQAQLLNDDVTVTHLVVVDGPDYLDKVHQVMEGVESTNDKVTCTVLPLPYNTGGDGYLCHRIYGALPMLVNTEYVTYLDDDNLMEPTHIQDMLNAIQTKGSRWGYTLRTIVNDSNTELMKDTCESLGLIRPTCINALDRHIDTNCYMFDRDLAVQLGPLWHRRTRDKKPDTMLEADRQIAQTLIQNEPSGACTRRYTIRYRVENRENSVKSEFFERGNRLVGSLDMEKRDIYVFLHTDTETQEAVALDSANAFINQLRQTFNVFDGYACLRGLPDNALVVCIIGDPFQYLETLRQLKQSTHASMKRVVVFTKDIQVPKDFHPTYADAVIQSFGLDMTMTMKTPRTHHIHIGDTVKDETLHGLKTTDGTETIFKLVTPEEIESTWTQRHVPLVWKGNHEVSDDIMKLEGSNWIDISRADAYCEKNGIEGTRVEKVREFLRMNHYSNDDIASIMYDRICQPIDDAIDKVIDVLKM